MEALTPFDIEELERIKADFFRFSPNISPRLNAILGIFTDKNGMIKNFGIRFYSKGNGPQINEVINDDLLFVPYENLTAINLKVEV